MYFQSQKLSWLVRITGLFGLLSTLTIEAAMQPQAVVAPQKPAALLLKLPLSFEENVGQIALPDLD